MNIFRSLIGKREKKFAIAGERIVQLISNGDWCVATDRITVDGAPLTYMYREAATRDGDSGWRFFAGDESRRYLDDLSHSAIYAVNTIANYEPAIIGYLSTPAPCAFEQLPNSREFRRVLPVDPPIERQPKKEQ